MAIRRRYLKFFPILLFVPALVLAEVAGPPLPLSLEKGPLPFDCATCHDPHGSRQACLLRKDEDRLCRTCHKGY